MLNGDKVLVTRHLTHIDTYIHVFDRIRFPHPATTEHDQKSLLSGIKMLLQPIKIRKKPTETCHVTCPDL